MGNTKSIILGKADFTIDNISIELGVELRYNGICVYAISEALKLRYGQYVDETDNHIARSFALILTNFSNYVNVKFDNDDLLVSCIHKKFRCEFILPGIDPELETRLYSSNIQRSARTNNTTIIACKINNKVKELMAINPSVLTRDALLPRDPKVGKIKKPKKYKKRKPKLAF